MKQASLRRFMTPGRAATLTWSERASEQSLTHYGYAIAARDREHPLNLGGAGRAEASRRRDNFLFAHIPRHKARLRRRSLGGGEGGCRRA